MARWLSSRVTGSPPLRVRAHIQGPSFPAFWLRSVMAITASVRAKIRPDHMKDPTSRIRFGSVLPKKARIIL